jgi:multidrug efflux pump subunit AcrB
VIRRRILAVPGVSQVTPIGGGEKQYQVTVDPASLRSHGVAFSQLLRALEEGNENVSAGIINQRGSEWLITGVGRVRNTERHRGHGRHPHGKGSQPRSPTWGRLRSAKHRSAARARRWASPR